MKKSLLFSLLLSCMPLVQAAREAMVGVNVDLQAPNNEAYAANIDAFPIDEWLNNEKIKTTLEEYVREGLDYTDFCAKLTAQVNNAPMTLAQFTAFYSDHIQTFLMSPQYQPSQGRKDLGMHASIEGSILAMAMQKAQNEKIRRVLEVEERNKREKRNAIQCAKKMEQLQQSPERGAGNNVRKGRRNSLPLDNSSASAQFDSRGQHQNGRGPATRRLSLGSPAELAELQKRTEAAIDPVPPFAPEEDLPVINNRQSPVLIAAAAITVAAGIYTVYTYGARAYAQVIRYWHSLFEKKNTQKAQNQKKAIDIATTKHLPSPQMHRPTKQHMFRHGH